MTPSLTASLVRLQILAVASKGPQDQLASPAAMGTQEAPEMTGKKADLVRMPDPATFTYPFHRNANVKLFLDLQVDPDLVVPTDHPATVDLPALTDAQDPLDLPVHLVALATLEIPDQRDHPAPLESCAQLVMPPLVVLVSLVVLVPPAAQEKEDVLETMEDPETQEPKETLAAQDKMVAQETLELPVKLETLEPLEAAITALQLAWLLAIRLDNLSFLASSIKYQNWYITLNIIA